MLGVVFCEYEKIGRKKEADKFEGEIIGGIGDIEAEDSLD
jgi:hypothetical protein